MYKADLRGFETMAVAQREDEQGGTPTAGEAEGPTAANRLAAKRAAKAAAKAAKRGTTTVPNPVAAGVSAASSFYARNARTIWSAAGAIVLLGAIFVGSQAHLGSQAHAAAQLLATGLATASAPIELADAEPVEDEDAPDESYPTATARAGKSRQTFAAVSKRYPESTAAKWSRLGEAHALYELGKHAEAQKLYAAVADHAKEDPYVRLRALEGSGFALEAQGKYGEAAKRFTELGTASGGSHKTLADFHRARMLIAQGKKKEGADLLQALVKAERARPASEGGVLFQNVVTSAESVLAELSVELGAPELRVDSPPSMEPAMLQPGGGSSGTGLSKEIVEALRQQLDNGTGSKGLTKDIVEQLERQVKDGPAPPLQPPVESAR